MIRTVSSLYRSRRFWAWILLVLTVVGLLFFTHRYLDDLAREKPGNFLEIFIEEMTGAYSAAPFIPFLVAAARRFRLDGRDWLASVPAHVATVLLYSAGHTTLMFASRSILFPLVGKGVYDYGVMPIRYAMEFPNHLLFYCMGIGVIYALDYYRSLKRREVEAAQLEARLSEANLQALQLQLEPHFLFNALNTISSVVYEDPRVADEMISRLSDLLRRLLARSTAQEVTLAEELDYLELYLDLMRARFADRLSVTVEVDPATREALVPQLLLQPLVENAIRHGVDRATTTVTVDVRAHRDDGRLVLRIRDHGPGLGASPSSNGNGIGLRNTSERIAQLYGDGHGLTLEDADGGGAVVTIQIPFHTEAAPAPKAR